MKQLQQELLEIQNKLEVTTDFIEKLELKDRELEVKLKLNLISTEDNYEACEGCSA